MRASLVVLVALTAAAHAAPPAPFAAAVKCHAVKWTRIADDTWFAYCAPKDPEASGVSYFLVIDGQQRLTTLDLELSADQ